MCYQECRWHAICNHTIRSKVECPKQCVKYGAIDTVETQLIAYCHACRQNVDSLGVAVQYRNDANRLCGRRSKPSHLAFASSFSMDNLRATAGPLPTVSVRRLSRIPTARSGSGPALPFPKRLTPTASTGDLRGKVSLRRQASVGRIMSVFMQEQREHEQERVEDAKFLLNVVDAVPELRLLTPQKPRLRVRVAKEAVSPTALATLPTAISPQQSQRFLSPAGIESKPLKLGSTECASSTATVSSPIKMHARSPIFASLEDRLLNPARDPLPSLPTLITLPSLPKPVQVPKHSTSGLTLNDVRRGLRNTKSSSRMLGDPPSDFLQHKSSPVDTMTSPSLWRSKSTRTLGSNQSHNTTTSFSLLTDGDWSGSPPSPPTLPATLMPVAPASSPSSKPVAKKDLIDIHDPAWLKKHGLKWDAHGLGVISASV